MVLDVDLHHPMHHQGWRDGCKLPHPKRKSECFGCNFTSSWAQLKSPEKSKTEIYTRWAPTRYKWSYKPYKWPYKWVTGVITLLIGVITPFITSRGPTLYIYIYKYSYIGHGTLPVTVTIRIIACLVGDSELNLHLSLLLGGVHAQYVLFLFIIYIYIYHVYPKFIPFNIEDIAASGRYRSPCHWDVVHRPSPRAGSQCRGMRCGGAQGCSHLEALSSYGEVVKQKG